MKPNDSIQEALAVAQSNGMLLAPHDRALRSALYRRANDPALTSPLPGIYADAAAWNALSPLKRYLQILKTLANMHPNWIFCGLSAAALYGLAVPYTRMHLIHIAGGETITKGRIARHHMRTPSPTLSREYVMREERLRESRIRNKGFLFARFSFKQVREVTPLLAILDSCGVPRVRAPLQLPDIIN